MALGNNKRDRDIARIDIAARVMARLSTYGVVRRLPDPRTPEQNAKADEIERRAAEWRAMVAVREANALIAELVGMEESEDILFGDTSMLENVLPEQWRPGMPIPDGAHVLRCKHNKASWEECPECDAADAAEKGGTGGKSGNDEKS